MFANTLSFLLAISRLLEEASLPVWVFGGWAEELWQVAPARAHKDIDFLYPAMTFEHLDHFIAKTNTIQELQPKRFSHKRAVVYQSVMIEFLLVQNAHKAYFTDFFSGRYYLEWPLDIFSYKVNIPGYKIRVASKQALSIYREHHKQVQSAYQRSLTFC